MLLYTATCSPQRIIYNAEYYNEDITNGKVGAGMISTEHSVMCSNYAMDDDEAMQSPHVYFQSTGKAPDTVLQGVHIHS